MIELGWRVKDVVTGFTGIAYGRAIYLRGCNRIMIQPVMEKGKEIDGYPVWVDEPQIKRVGRMKISLDVEPETEKPGGPPSKNG
ncbi:MAG TPA: hypothetical protein DCL81_08555 [Algoriphagus sp.]|nr:hypothetical protein [Algoriphagus sp.]